jgi:hypothetical protein
VPILVIVISGPEKHRYQDGKNEQDLLHQVIIRICCCVFSFIGHRIHT